LDPFQFTMPDLAEGTGIFLLLQEDDQVIREG
jgi:hypothetical protein